MDSVLPAIQTVLLSGPDVTIPLWQILALLAVICTAAAFERHRLMLVVSYLFLTHWVFIENTNLLVFNGMSFITVLAFGAFGILGAFFTLHQGVTSKA